MKVSPTSPHIDDDETYPAEDSVDMLELTYITLMQEIEAEIVSASLSTVLDYTGLNVTNKCLSEDEQRKLVEELNRHEGIMIASGNTLPPPAYGVVCYIDA
ncbi:hypothetical protein PHMEG_00018686 [Phytophthora megakarya]|uniref:Reverse transcriptase n=1 Tax=Phytophthora megakarya TaxID=4795 RepID=A0A225VTS0_9STRA|nr:hypothetical protein PHMEG_00018686 [Phytophthora megakarya]